MKLEKIQDGVRIGREVIKIDDLSPEIREKLVLYGLFVKIQRAGAGKSDPLQAQLEMLRALKRGDWTVGRSSSPEKILEKLPPELRAEVEKYLR